MSFFYYLYKKKLIVKNKNRNNYVVCFLVVFILMFFSCQKDKPIEPSNITTSAITNVNCHSAQSGGIIKPESDLHILQKGVCYGKTSQPDTGDSRTIDGIGIDNYISILSGLEIKTQYFVRAYIISSFGLEYGEENSFTTSSCDSFIYGGKTYHAVQIGNQCWMTENLNIGSTVHGYLNQHDNNTLELYAYNNQDSNLTNYGGLYQWSELVGYTTGSNSSPSGIQGIAPNGWHIPSDAEWQELELFIGMTNTEVNSIGWRGMYSACLKPSGSTGFSVQYGGYRIVGGNFSGIDFNGYYWTSTQANASDAWYRIIDVNSALIKRDVEGIYHGMSVRCVKD